MNFFFFFQAEDGIRDRSPSRGLGDVYKRQVRYMLPREMWTPADEAVYKPLDLLGTPMDEAQALQFKAIKYAFTRHYTLNDWYHKFCDTRGFTPDGVNTNDDLNKIPLVPDLTFKPVSYTHLTLP